MKKMPCLFERTFNSDRTFEIHDRVTPGCEWVYNGMAIPTVKWDGTACAVIGGKLYKRYDAKRGKTPPAGAIPCDEPDPVTGHHPHWIAVGDEPESKHHLAAWNALAHPLSDGTYELCGPKLQGNPHRLDRPQFIRHGAHLAIVNDFSFASLRAFLEKFDKEGIVFHAGLDLRCKIRRADFGFAWPIPEGGGDASP